MGGVAWTSGRSYDSGSTATLHTSGSTAALHTQRRGVGAVVAVALLSGCILLEQRLLAEDPHAVVVRFPGGFDRGVYQRGIARGVADWCQVPPDVAAAFAHADVPVATRRGLRPSQRFECDIEYGPFDPVALDSHLLAVMLLDAKAATGRRRAARARGRAVFSTGTCGRARASSAALSRPTIRGLRSAFASSKRPCSRRRTSTRTRERSIGGWSGFFLGFVVRALYDVQYKLVTSRGVVPRSSGFLAFEDGLSRATGWRG